MTVCDQRMAELEDEIAERLRLERRAADEIEQLQREVTKISNERAALAFENERLRADKAELMEALQTIAALIDEDIFQADEIALATIAKVSK